MYKKNWLEGYVSNFKGNIFEILNKRTSSGKVREVARRAPGVRAIAITENDEFIISREERDYLEKEIDYRLPGGKVVDSLAEYLKIISRGTLAEKIIEAVIMELEEETGITATLVELFRVSNSSGSVDCDLNYFVMKGLTFGKPRPEDDEKIEVLKLSLEDTIDLVLSEKMSEDRSRIVLLDYLLKNYPMNVADRIVRNNTK